MLNKMFLKELKNLIITSIDPEIKDVVYLGIAHALIEKIDIDDQAIANRTLFVSIADEIGEVFLIDKELLVSKIVNLAKYKLSYFNSEKTEIPVNYLEFLGISAYMSEEQYNSVNKYFNTFFNAYQATKLVYQFER